MAVADSRAEYELFILNSDRHATSLGARIRMPTCYFKDFTHLRISEQSFQITIATQLESLSPVD